jgi:predicted MFS family arabinose efflux permease
MIIGPALTGQLAIHLNWQYAFIFTSLPTVIVGIIIWFVLKETKPAEVSTAGRAFPETQPESMSMKWKDVPKIFAYRNCTLSFIANILIMTGFWGVVSFGTTYWVDEAKLTIEQATFLSSLSGIVRLGRKPLSSIFTLYIAVSMLILYLAHGLLAQISFILVMGCCGFVSVLFVAIICQESVPPAIAATTTAIGMATGELFGTSIGPRILGTLGDRYGLKIIFLAAAITTAAAFAITFALTETGKAKIEKMQKAATAAH